MRASRADAPPRALEPRATRVSRRRFLRAAGVAGVGAASLVLVGCGGDDGPQPSRPQEQTTATLNDGAQASNAPAAPSVRRLLLPGRTCETCAIEEPAFAPVAGARALFGVHQGAGYRIELPDTWNGTLILWARGFSGLNPDGTGFNPVLGFGQEVPGRSVLAPSGVAWAASTYRTNGFAPAVGVDDLLALKDLFTREAGAPAQTLCVGASMGGATAQLMAQEFPQEIAGALALCGALSNAEAVDYLASWHAVASWLIGEPPHQADAAGLAAWAGALGRVQTDGSLLLTARGEQFAAVMRALTGGERFGFAAGLARQWPENFALGAVFWPQILARGTPMPGAVIAHDSQILAFDTMAVVYAGDPPGLLDTDALNAEVIRFAAPPADRANPALGPATGRLRTPLLTLKNTGDLFTSISLDQTYRARVDAAGDGDHLVMRAIRRAGHCNFSLPEGVQALQDLQLWVLDGVRPAGEDLRGDLRAAGLAFTDPLEQTDPLRPMGVEAGAGAAG